MVINKGDRVKCIIGGFVNHSDIPIVVPIVGKIYTVRDVVRSLLSNRCGLLLEEIRNDTIPHPSCRGMIEPDFNCVRFVKIG